MIKELLHAKIKSPLNAGKSRPSLTVQEHEPVLRKDWFFVPTLRVQVVRSWNRSRIKSGMTLNRGISGQAQWDDN
ncbi:MAG: hypothetical protein GX457_16235 [Thermotogaceae bacterium]|jgi:hypothetical protein|nr:hypothetical protein [Thermotogaceae bacterium]